MQTLRAYQELVEEELKKILLNNNPAELYDPVRYMLSLGGKRLRPSLLLMSCEMFGGNPKNAMGPALGIEVFHNFTLLHDDIMDKAPLRRAKETVHKKWNPDIAILSGDTMFVKSCELMMQVEEKYLRRVMGLFTATAIKVCEGQQYDMNFEFMEPVRKKDYLEMIRLKTAVLIGCSLEMGAIIAGADENESTLIRDFGINLGMAFQLHDDLLDVYGDENKFGKKAGGDILANKKTFLLITALETAINGPLTDLKNWISKKEFDPEEKIEAVKEIFQHLGIREKTQAEMEEYFHRALQALDETKISSEKKEPLRNLAEELMVREK